MSVFLLFFRGNARYRTPLTVPANPLSLRANDDGADISAKTVHGFLHREEMQGWQ